MPKILPVSRDVHMSLVTFLPLFIWALSLSFHMHIQVVFATGIPKSWDPGIFGHISRFPGIKVRETGKIPGFPGILRIFYPGIRISGIFANTNLRPDPIQPFQNGSRSDPDPAKVDLDPDLGSWIGDPVHH